MSNNIYNLIWDFNLCTSNSFLKVVPGENEIAIETAHIQIEMVRKRTKKNVKWCKKHTLLSSTICLSRPYHFRFFRGCLSQILLGFWPTCCYCCTSIWSNNFLRERKSSYLSFFVWVCFLCSFFSHLLNPLLSSFIKRFHCFLFLLLTLHFFITQDFFLSLSSYPSISSCHSYTYSVISSPPRPAPLISFFPL